MLALTSDLTQELSRKQFCMVHEVSLLPFSCEFLIFLQYELYLLKHIKILFAAFSSVPFSSVAQSCPTLCDPMNHVSQASLSITNSRSSA